MYTIQKLKPDRNFYPALIPLSVLVIGAFLGFLFGFEASFIFIAIIFWVYAAYSLLTWIRTHNGNYLIPALFQISAGLLAFATSSLINQYPRHQGSIPALIIFLLVLEIFLLVWTIFLTINRKLKWRGREVLELAAVPVNETGSGYTSRPLPAGRTEFTKSQILEFAEFTQRNLISVTYVGKEQAVFVPVMMGREYLFILGLKSDYTDETWVAFNYDGDVSVNISHRDYMNYQEALSFDKLCESLGSLFIEFMGMYHRGEGVRIIDRMDALKISVYS